MNYFEQFYTERYIKSPEKTQEVVDMFITAFGEEFYQEMMKENLTITVRKLEKCNIDQIIISKYDRVSIIVLFIDDNGKFYNISHMGGYSKEDLGSLIYETFWNNKPF